MQKNLYSDILLIITPYVKKNHERVAQSIHDQIINIYRKVIIDKVKEMTHEEICKLGYKKDDSSNSPSALIVPKDI